MTRSIAAVAAGLCCIFALTLAGDAMVPLLFPRAFRGPEGGGATGPLLVTGGYALLAVVAGGYLTAHLASGHRARHSLVLGGLLLALAFAGTLAAWETTPAWYHAAALALVMPAAWLGGRLKGRPR